MKFIKLFVTTLILGILGTMQSHASPRPDIMPAYYEEIGVDSAISLMKSVESIIDKNLPPGINEPVLGEIDIAAFLSRREKLAKQGIVLSPGQYNFYVPVLLVDFQDKIFQVDPAKFDSLVFDNTNLPLSYKPKTVYDFYRIESLDKLLLATQHPPDSLGVTTVSNYSTYVNADYGFGQYPHNTQKLTEDLLTKLFADNPGLDFSIYDNDGDGFVDAVIIVHAGKGAELTRSTNDIWSHKWNISTRTFNGMKFSAFSIQPEYWVSPGDMTIGVYAHETGHLFKLPDLYDLDNSSRGLGSWSLMAGGSWNGSRGNNPAGFDAWCLSKLGFRFVTVHAMGTKQYRIHVGEIVKIPLNPADPLEYDLLHYRTKKGNDSSLAWNGLHVYRVDDHRSNNTGEWTNNSLPTDRNYRVALLQADGLYELEYNRSSGNRGDVYPYVRVSNTGATTVNVINDTTVPSIVYYKRYDPKVRISGITESVDNYGPMVYVTVEQCECRQGDMNLDGELTIEDVHMLVDICYFGAPDVLLTHCPLSVGDVDCSGFVDATDLQYLIDVVAFGGRFPCTQCQ